MAYDSKKDRYPAAVYAHQPARVAEEVTPDDNNDLPNYYAKALYVGVGGDITVISVGDLEILPGIVLFKSVPIGILPVQVRRVLATGTTAANIVALYD